MKVKVIFENKTTNVYPQMLSLMTMSSIGFLGIIMAEQVKADLPDPYKQVCVELQTPSGNYDYDLTLAQRNFVNVCNAIADLSNDTDDALVASLRHEEAAAQGSSTLKTSQQQMANLAQRLAILHKNHNQGGSAGDDSQANVLDANRWGIFINGDLNNGNRKKTVDITGTNGLGDASIENSGMVSQGERAYEFNNKQVTMGADYRLPSEKFILGAALGFNRQDGSFKSDAGTIDLNGHHLSLYGTYVLSDQAYLDGTLGFGKNKIKSSRLVPKAGLTEFGRAFAKPDSNQLTASIGGGYDMPNGKYTITPFTRFDYTKTSIDAYTETVDSAASQGMALAVEKQDVQSLVGNLGVRVSSPMQTSSGLIIPQASIELAHEFKNDARDIEARLLITDNVQNITANPVAATADPDRTLVKVGLGVAAMFGKGQSGFAQIESIQSSKDFKDTAFKFGYRAEF